MFLVVRDYWTFYAFIYRQKRGVNQDLKEASKLHPLIVCDQLAHQHDRKLNEYKLQWFWPLDFTKEPKTGYSLPSASFTSLNSNKLQEEQQSESLNKSQRLENYGSQALTSHRR
jgi:hypothetical protein